VSSSSNRTLKEGHVTSGYQIGPLPHGGDTVAGSQRPTYCSAGEPVDQADAEASGAQNCCFEHECATRRHIVERYVNAQNSSGVAHN
jgi:hypothetical protein